MPLHTLTLNQCLFDVLHPVQDEVEEGDATFLHAVHPLAVVEEAGEL